MTFICLGPRADPHAPRFAMPPGATDCHAHVIGLPPAYPFVPERGYTPPEAPLAAFRSMHAALGIERAVIVTPSVHGTDNRITLEAIAGYGPEARGIAVVGPDIAERELARLHDGGIRGVRLNVLWGGGVGLHAFRPLAARIRPLGWHIQLLIKIGEHLADLAPAIRGAGVPVVVDHMGYLPVGRPNDDPSFRLLLDLAGSGHVWVKLSGNYRIAGDHPHYRDAIPRARALISANPEQMVWGTDWPHVSLRDNMPDTGDLLDAVGDYAPGAAARRAILTDNPARLYGF